MRETIRRHARNFCGQCHEASRTSAKPAALAIFNLDSDDWHQGLTVERLRGGFPRRLNARLDETGRRDLQAFIEHEIGLRKP